MAHTKATPTEQSPHRSRLSTAFNRFARAWLATQRRKRVVGKDDVRLLLERTSRELAAVEERHDTADHRNYGRTEVRYFLGFIASSVRFDRPSLALLNTLSNSIKYEPLANTDLVLTHDWFSYHAPRWRRELAHIAGKPNLKVLEVGAFEGNATCWLLRNILTHDTSRIVCVDIAFPRSFGKNVAACHAEHKVLALHGASHVVLRQLVDSFDFIYVDGSHFMADTLIDALLTWKLAKAGGLITFDDYAFDRIPLMGGLTPENTPRPAIDAFLRLYQGAYRLLHKGWQVTIRKEHER